jgi:hypothetical protein
VPLQATDIGGQLRLLGRQVRRAGRNAAAADRTGDRIEEVAGPDNCGRATDRATSARHLRRHDPRRLPLSAGVHQYLRRRRPAQDRLPARSCRGSIDTRRQHPLHAAADADAHGVDQLPDSTLRSGRHGLLHAVARALRAWQLKTFASIMAAYNELERLHQGSRRRNSARRI